MNPQPKPVKKTSCRLPDCERPRYGLARLCFRHAQERVRLKREESRTKKLDRKKKSKKYQKKERDILIDKCDGVFSKIVRSLGYCLWPATEGDEHKGHLECSHIFSRMHMAIRWHELNAKPLCTAHHFKWHKHPAEATVFLVTIRTPEEIKWLKERTNTIKQWTTEELKALLATLQEKLSKI